MLINVRVDINDAQYSLDVPETLIAEAGDFFDKLDQDMDHGWQMSRWWVPDPDATQRCQIVADKLLSAIENDNHEFGSLLCAYILRKRPTTRRMSLNTEGQIQGNEFFDE